MSISTKYRHFREITSGLINRIICYVIYNKKALSWEFLAIPNDTKNKSNVPACPS